MAVSISIVFDDESIMAGLKALQAKVDDLTPVMDEIGQTAVTNTLDRFERGVDPDGKPWEPSFRAQRDDGQTLIDSGRLRDSITHRPAADHVDVGTNVIYAAVHQFGAVIKAKTSKGLRFKIPGVGWITKGSVTIPARPFLGISNDDRADIKDILNDHLTGAGAAP